MTAIIIIAIIVSTIVAVFASAAKHDKAIENKKPKAIKSSLSTASRKILNLYKTLPEDSQRLVGLEASLRALDVKHGVENVNAHFMTYEFPYIREGKRSFSWKPSAHNRGMLCRNYGCKMAEYYEIYSGIEGIASDLEKQARAFEIAGVQDSLDNLANIRDAIRQEREIIQETTRKYT